MSVKIHNDTGGDQASKHPERTRRPYVASAHPPSEPRGACERSRLATGSADGAKHRWCVHGLRDDRLCLSCPPWRRMWDFGDVSERDDQPLSLAYREDERRYSEDPHGLGGI